MLRIANLQQIEKLHKVLLCHIPEAGRYSMVIRTCSLRNYTYFSGKWVQDGLIAFLVYLINFNLRLC